MKLGIIGAGNIASMVAPTLVQLPQIELTAIAARDYDRAVAFKDRFNVKKAYGRYEDLYADPEVEMVYICVPHAFHYPIMMDAMKAGKAVFSEKAFTMTAEQARSVKRYSQEHNIFAAEAVWTRYMPSVGIINDALASGIIGRPVALTCNLGMPLMHKPFRYDRNISGGALLNVGVYTLNFAIQHFGKDFKDITTVASFNNQQTDDMETSIIHYNDGRMATLNNSIVSRTDKQGIFYGEKGYAVIDNINNPLVANFYDVPGNLIKSIKMPEQISGYEYEFIEIEKIMSEGGIESTSMPMDETIYIMELFDSIRADIGLTYPQDTDPVE